ncbi:YMGG-like glycine zipper-containing protein [Geomonas subterranea]|uniref:YMGG-like glycine zipper-containing protein n=1 Tax=Geomonas subterranea TaxID=2847989 RepID=UPI001CD260FE|nr:YMGG-like glycine zipper-containing protein [Geomonas fuzhouensis]
MKRRISSVCVLMALGGCVTVPTGPSVKVLPTKGKSFETFMKEDATCRQWANSQIGSPVQETYDKNMATSAVVGTAVGTGVGAVLGSASGNTGAGAAIGAATGLLFGAAAGSGSAQVYGAQAQRQYDNAYVQCMYTYNNQVPGTRQTVAARPAPPPPARVVTPPVATPPPPVAPPPVMAPPPPPGPELILPPPPEEYEAEPPEFVYSPRLDAYVAVGVPFDLVYSGNEYFYFYGGNWYRSAYYNGPWSYVPRRSYPQLFVRYEVVNIRHYRDVEYRRYVRDRGHYDGRVYRPQYRRIVRHRPGY